MGRERDRAADRKTDFDRYRNKRQTDWWGWDG